MIQRRELHIMRFFVYATVTVIFIASTSLAEAQTKGTMRTGNWTVGAAIGMQNETLDGTAFAFGLYADLELGPALSIGPLLQIGNTSDMFQLGLTAQLKYSVGVQSMPQLRPYAQAGLGFIYADLDLPRTGEVDDISFLIPLGLGVEYKLSEYISADASVLFNFTNLDIRDENFFMTWLIGLKFVF